MGQIGFRITLQVSGAAYQTKDQISHSGCTVSDTGIFCKPFLEFMSHGSKVIVVFGHLVDTEWVGYQFLISSCTVKWHPLFFLPLLLPQMLIRFISQRTKQ